MNAISQRQESAEQIRARYIASLDAIDLAGELMTEEMVAVVKTGNAHTVGRYVLSQMRAWADRMVSRELSL